MHVTPSVVNLPSMISIPWHKLHPKNHEDLCTFVKVIVKNDWHLFYSDTLYMLMRDMVYVLHVLGAGK